MSALPISRINGSRPLETGKTFKARHLSARRHLRFTALITPDHSEAMNETGVSRYRYFQILGLASFTLSVFPCRL